jgi:tRNA(fMet)-specific endonuclease VapC
MAVEIVIDTNRYRDFVDGKPDAVAVFRLAPKIYVPLVVVAELRAGFAVGSRGAENQRVFERFIHRPRVQLLMPAMETTRHYAALYRQLRDSGTPIPTNDLWIAALVVQHDVPLYSRDAHFDLIPQLPRIERGE